MKREIAHRIFAFEFNESNLQMKEGDEQYSPHYFLTPTGAKVNRLFVVGTLIKKKDIGNEGKFWRGCIVDPTGTISVLAGQYQPEASKILAKITKPEFIAVVGKPNTYTTKEGEVLTSIRAERLQIVDETTRDIWVLDTAKQTMMRLAKLKGTDPDMVKAKEHYSINIEYYRAKITQALNSFYSSSAFYDNDVSNKILDGELSTNCSYSENWHSIKKIVYKRANYTCQYCGKTELGVNAHHTKHLIKGGKNELNNLVCICAECHSILHPKNKNLEKQYLLKLESNYFLNRRFHLT